MRTNFSHGAVKPTLGRKRTVNRNFVPADMTRKGRLSRMESQFRIEEVDDREGELITSVAIRKDALRVLAFALSYGAGDVQCKNPGMLKSLSSQLMTIANFHDGGNVDPREILVDQNGVGIVDEVYMADGRRYSFQTDQYYPEEAENSNGQAADAAADDEE